MLFILTLLPCTARETEVSGQKAQNVFVYHIPDEDKAQNVSEENKEPVQADNVSDDVTADTYAANSENDDEDADDNENLEDDNYDYSADYGMEDMYSDVLKGYASYDEGEEDEVTLEDSGDNIASINIKRPQKVDAANYTKLNTTPMKIYNGNYSKFNLPELSVAPLGSSAYSDIGAWQFGTTYNQYIDTGELEQTSGIYSRYKYKNLSLETSYSKTINSTNNNYNDKLFFSPSYKLNQYMTLKPVLSTDLTKQTKKAEFVLSLNPLGKKDSDRIRLDLGISQQYSELTDTFRNQFRFNTSFKF